VGHVNTRLVGVASLLHVAGVVKQIVNIVVAAGAMNRIVRHVGVEDVNN
jgi:hypothetical protein